MRRFRYRADETIRPPIHRLYRGATCRAIVKYPEQSTGVGVPRLVFEVATTVASDVFG